MATIDMQQTISSQVAENDQLQQEEVQLTELLPVKQSRIRENGVYKNSDATDALKLLQSFTTDSCIDHVEHELRSQNSPFCKRIGQTEQGKQDNDKQWQGDKVRRRKIRVCDKYMIDGIENGEKDKTDNQKSTIETRLRDRRRKRVITKSINDSDSKSRKEKVATDKIQKHEIIFVQDDKGDLSEFNEQEESKTYLDLDKNSHLNDEIYISGREIVDDRQRRRISSDDTGRICENDSSRTTDGALLERVGISSDMKKNTRMLLENSFNESKIDVQTISLNCVIENENNNSSRFRVEENYTNESDTIDNVALIESSLSSSSSSSKKENVSDSENGRKGMVLRRAARGAGTSSQKNEEKNYCCILCDARFKGSAGLRNHYKIAHETGPSFKCDYCGKEFPLKERVKLHIRIHTGFKPHKCVDCGKCFARAGQLVSHRSTHSQIKPFRCELCPGMFTCAANLTLHLKRHNGQKDYKCELCGRAFVRRDALKKHLDCLHRDVKSYFCAICNKTFKGHLPQHMRTHARDRPHGCATCGQRFAQKSQLTVHQRTHSGQRPFRCLVCWQAFAHSTALKLHTRRHTGERPFKCAECNAGFTQLPHWKKHMKCIHGRDDPYNCKRCNTFFKMKSDLESHEKTCQAGSESKLGTSDNCNKDTVPVITISPAIQSTPQVVPNEVVTDKSLPPTAKYKVMTVARMRLLLAVLLKRISKQERLDELGFGKRLIDNVLHDCLISAGKDPVPSNGLSEHERLTKNLEIFLKWTVPKEHWEKFRKLNKTPEDILETLTTT
ncbi:zinc finger protein 239-like [Ceratina calcarata]|uniref:Zinc finger protein 239-like n=1 Tax=Ceratina calcarata TaxID=156304 RepID=A0AAJ7W9F9_9HYME|nr:zinc finger protein 239-like [Ceratina calcarata]XP_026668091.1 zinc finger protein 239-like [Ceratina calcarata]